MSILPKNRLSKLNISTFSYLCCLAFFVTLTACDDESETPVVIAGTMMAGEAVGGEAVAGEAVAGEAVAGEAVAGEAVAGEAVAGEAVAGEAVAGTMQPTEGLPLGDLIPETAAAMCQGLLGCCDMQDHELFFMSFQANPRYEEIVSNLPPNVEFTEATCPQVMSDILTAAPFGRWIEQVNAGRVIYNALEAESCLNQLQQAECGSDFLAALYDGTCLSYVPPLGGAEQRKMFQRTAAMGEECMALTDGQGGVVYGTCDPTVAFCCVRREDGTCKIAEQTEIGECVAVSPIGEPCTIFPDTQLCATGHECNIDTNVCEPPVEYVPAQEGDVCSENFTITGLCQDSYCDVTGDGTCKALKADGDACVFSDECASGACIENICSADQYCR